MSHFFDRKRKAAATISTGALLLILAAVAVGGYLYIYGVPAGSTASLGTSPLGGGATTTTTGYTKNYNLGALYTLTNAKSGGTLTTTSEAIVAFNTYGSRLSNTATLYGKTGTTIASGTTATTVPVYPSDNGFLLINIDTGTTDLPNIVQIKGNNPQFTDCKWMPVTNTNINELVCELEISRLGTPNYEAGTTAIATTFKVVGIPDDNAATISNPADQASIGTTSNTDVYITWTFTALTANQAHALARAYVTSNQTSSELDVKELKIMSDAGIVMMSDQSQSYTTYSLTNPRATGTAAGVSQTWKFWPLAEDDASDYSEAILLGRGSSDADDIRIRMWGKLSITTSGHAVTAVLNYRFIGANNSLTAVSTDSVVLAA